MSLHPSWPLGEYLCHVVVHMRAEVHSFMPQKIVSAIRPYSSERLRAVHRDATLTESFNVKCFRSHNVGSRVVASDDEAAEYQPDPPKTRGRGRGRGGRGGGPGSRGGRGRGRGRGRGGATRCVNFVLSHYAIS